MSRFKQSIVPLKKQIAELEFIIAKSDVKSWQAVQDIVRAGLASKAFEIGDQFLANYDGNPIVWDVIGIDHDTPVDPNFTHSLTIQSHDCILNVQFDAPEALYFAEAELPPGEHIFSSSSVKYTFTTAQAVPAGGQVYINAWETEGYVPTKITTYAADRTTAIESNLAVTPAELGEDTLLPVNYHARCRYGSNNYIESAIKQWLNSNDESFVWTPKTNYDRPPTSSNYSGKGFLQLIDPDLVAVLGAVDKQVARNTATDGGGQDSFSDKVFPLSRVEVFGGAEGVITGEQAYRYYSELAENPTTGEIVGRIKYLNSSARFWWLRSPGVGYASGPRGVYASGTVGFNDAVYARGAAPACCIV